MRSLKYFIALIILASSVSACTVVDNQNGESAHDFIATVSSSDQYEIAASKMALSKSNNYAVREIAQNMITDHTKSDRDLMSVLADNRILASAPGLTPEQQKKIDELNFAPNFDQEYLYQQNKAHKQAIDLFQSYSTDGDNAALRDFANRTLPKLKKHLHMIERARSK